MSAIRGPSLAPGATIGILGGGQLGRMLAMAAARLGLRCHIYAPETDSCAFDVVRTHTCAAYDDEAALARFADSVDLITYEFENVPAQTAAFLSARRPVLPDPSVLAITQDRLAEKTFINRLGIATAPFAAIDTLTDIPAALEAIGRPAVLKTQRLGYDGKGQRKIGPADDAVAAWTALGRVPCVAEAFVSFTCEVSVVAARARNGHVECFDVTENEHRNHILKTSRAPARIAPEVAEEARRIAATIAEAFDYVGVLAVEMFVGGGQNGSVLVNETAPRVHNSGHWTLDGCTVSQFEQHIRAIAGWPLAAPVRTAAVEMTNLIGHEIDDIPAWLETTGACVHHYGKHETRDGRKMGHVTKIL